MSRTLSIRNRQRVRRIDTALLRRITLHVLKTQLGVAEFELAIHLVGASEMARVNQTFLDHEGSTDVITFDHSATVGQASSLSRTPGALSKSSNAPTRPSPSENRDRLEACPTLHGEIFISLDDALKQAREFRTSWQSELVRYVIHGLLHLCGHDDFKPALRRHMKRAESHLLREVNKCFTLARLGTRNPKPGTSKSAIGHRPSAI
jgi:probable rRNA maturation factor